jgi:hypothetical protein
MQRKISLRLPIDIFEDLRDEALKHRISISDVVRDKILVPRSSIISEKANTPNFLQIENTKEPANESYFATLEILHLLREFLFERNGQILKKIDDKMEKRFGKDRKKIL